MCGWVTLLTHLAWLFLEIPLLLLLTFLSLQRVVALREKSTRKSHLYLIFHFSFFIFHFEASDVFVVAGVVILAALDPRKDRT